MASGVPLTDDDRWPWLERIGRAMQSCDESGRSAVIACSALRAAYRRYLLEQSQEVQFAFLKGSRESILARMRGRDDHFMPTDLLDSQFAALEEPEDAIVADIRKSPPEIVDEIVLALGFPD
jgi:gluconokinase